MKPVENLRSAMFFSGEIVLEKKETIIKKTKKCQVEMVFQTNGSKLDIDNIGAAVTWRKIHLDKQGEKSVFLEKNRKILDIKLCPIAMALKAAKKEIKNNFRALITIFTDSQKVLKII